MGGSPTQSCMACVCATGRPPAYQGQPAREQQLRLTAQGSDVIHHLQDKAAAQPLRGTRTEPWRWPEDWRVQGQGREGAGTSAALGLPYTRSMDLELALTAWASSCSTSRWDCASSRMLERQTRQQACHLLTNGRGGLNWEI